MLSSNPSYYFFVLPTGLYLFIFYLNTLLGVLESPIRWTWSAHWNFLNLITFERTGFIIRDPYEYSYIFQKPELKC